MTGKKDCGKRNPKSMVGPDYELTDICTLGFGKLWKIFGQGSDIII